MFQASFGGNALCRLRQFPIAQRPQQVAREDHTLPATLGQPLVGQEIGALLQSLFGVSAKPQVTQPTYAAEQLLVEPGGPNHAGLPLDWQV